MSIRCLWYADLSSPPIPSNEYDCGQLCGVADGLNYLHECGVIHGDLRAVSSLAFRKKFMLIEIKREMSWYQTKGNHV